MSIWLVSLNLLAQMNRYDTLRAMRSGLQRSEPSHDFWAILLGGVALVGSLAMLAQILSRRDRRPARSTDFLTDAAHRLGLDRPALRDLRRLATRARLPHPASMLLSPANLAHAVRQAQGRGKDDRLRAHAEELSQRLFGVPLPSDGPHATPTAPVR